MDPLQELAGLGWTPEQIKATTIESARKHGVPEEEALALLGVEGYSPETPVSPKGAIGPMQLMPGTAQALEVDPWDFEQNIDGGLRYYKEQREKFGTPEIAYAAYNAGPGAVKGGRVPQNKETPGAVAKFLRFLGPLAAEAAELGPLEELAQIGVEAAADPLAELQAIGQAPEAGGTPALRGEGIKPFDATSETLAQFGPPWFGEQKPKSVMMDDATYAELQAKYPVFKEESISSRKDKPGIKSTYRAPSEKFEELTAEEPSFGERIFESLGQLVDPKLIAGLGGQAVAQPERHEELRAEAPLAAGGDRIPRMRSDQATSFELLSKNIAAVNRPILESLVGYAGIAEDVLAFPYRTITGSKAPIQRPLTAIAERLKERGAPEQLLPNEDEWLATLPGQVVGGLGAYLLPGKFVPKGGVSLFEKFLHNLGMFVPADVALGYAREGEEGAKRGLFHAVPNAAAFTVAQALPGRPLQSSATGTVFAGSAVVAGERDPKKLTADFLTGAGLHWLGSRGEAKREKFEKFVTDWKRGNGVSEKEFDQVKENLGAQVPEEEQPTSLKEKYQKEMEIFANETAEWKDLRRELPLRKPPSPQPAPARGEGVEGALSGRPAPPETLKSPFTRAGEEVFPEWTETASPRGNPLNFKSGETAAKRVEWLNRNRPNLEARVAETPEGWRVEVKSRVQGPWVRGQEAGPSRFVARSGEVLEVGEKGWEEVSAGTAVTRVPPGRRASAQEPGPEARGQEAGETLALRKEGGETFANTAALLKEGKSKLMAPEGPSYDLDRAVERQDLATIIKAFGGFDPRAEALKNFAPEEQRRLRLFSRKGSQKPDELLQELKGAYPDLFPHETDAELLGAIADGSIYKKFDLDKIAQEEADYYERINGQATAEGLDAQGLAAVEADVKREIIAERIADSGEKSAGEDLTNFWDEAEAAYNLRKQQSQQLAVPPTELSTEARQIKRVYPDITDEQATILAQAPALRKQMAAGNWEALAREKANAQISDQGAQGSLEGLGTGLFKGAAAVKTPPSPQPSPHGGEGVKGVQAGTPAPPKKLQVPGLDAEAGAAVKPDPEIGPDGEVKYLHSGGPDTASMARNLEARLWEGLANLRIRPPSKYLQQRMKAHVPPEFLPRASEFKNFINMVYFPRWVAEKWDAFRPYYEGDLQADDIMANHRVEVWGRLKPYFRELSGKERRRVHEATLKLDKIESAEKRRGLEEEIDGQGPDWFRQKFKLTAKEADAAHGLFDAYRYVRLETVKAMQQDVIDLAMKHGLNEKSSREFMEDVLERDLQGDYYPLYYSIEKYLPGRGQALHDILTRQRENFQFWSRARALYMFPHTRWGPYWLYVWEKSPSGQPSPIKGEGVKGEDKLLWAGAAESIGEYKKMRAGLEKEFAGQEVEFRANRKEKVPMELYNNVDMPGLAAIMELARKKFEGEAWEKFLEAKQAFFAQKGWGSHKIHREGVPGFETANDKRVISDYFEGWIGMQGKTHRVRAFSDAWQGFAKRNGGTNEGLMKYTQGYVNYLLEHPREATKIRTLLYHLYLGGSMGFRVLHGLHALQTAWPEMRTISKRPGAALVRAIRDRAQLLAFEQGWSKNPGIKGEELAALEQGRRRAALSTDYTAEMAARSNSPMYRFLNEEPQGLAAKAKRAFDLIYYPTALDRGTRESIFLAAVRELRGKGPITAAVIDRAAKIVDNSMYRYARGERPRFMRREGVLPTIFQTWSAKYFQQIFRYLRDAEGQGFRKLMDPSFGRLIAAAGMVGGLNALGVKDALTFAYRKVYGRDAEDDSKHYLKTILGDTGGEALNRVMFRGLPAGVMGFDLSQRMVHHLPWNYLFGLVEKPWQIAGAVTGPVEAVARAGHALAENRPGRALEALAPTWLRNPMAAARLYGEGPTTVSGRPILGPDFKQRKATLAEAGRKAIGLQPTRLSEEQSKHETIKHLQESQAAKVRDFSSRFAQAVTDKDAAGRREVLTELRAYNQEMKEKRRFADMILPSQFQAAVQIRLRPVLPEKSAKRTALRERR